MQIIHLPLTPAVRFGFAGLVFGAGLLVWFSQIELLWRCFAIVISMLVGWWSWRRYRIWRPAAVGINADRSIDCILASGRVVTVHQIQLGIVQPLLVCARLIGQGGESLDLFVTAVCIEKRRHWQLRRALLAWREPLIDAGLPEKDPSAGSVR